MADKSTLGIYWGPRAFSLIRVQKKTATNIFHIPYDAPIETAEENKDIPQGLRISTLLQKTLADNNITTKKINVALPAKDLIFRAFIIPWMQPNEVKNVVEFEATKYVPIPLDELSYTFHMVTITDKSQKSLLILFVGIRKNVLEKYTGILNHIGLTVDHIEPASVSLCNALLARGAISKGQSTAIIEIEPAGGKIIIFAQETVQFIREFQLPDDLSDIDSFQAKLFNDLRVSFNFYTRQNPSGKINKITLLSLEEFSGLAKALTEELGIPTTSTTASQILQNDEGKDLGQLNAYGIALRDKKFLTQNLDLSETAKQKKFTGEGLNLKMTGSVIGSCALILVLTIFGGNHLVSGKKTRIAELREKQGVFLSSTDAQITEMKDGINTKLTAYQSIRTGSDVREYMMKIPEALPDGTWITLFDVQYSEQYSRDDRKNISKAKIIFEGYAYLANTNEEFRLVNNLVSTLKEDESFKSLFPNIDLISVKQSQANEFPVTYFKVECN